MGEGAGVDPLDEVFEVFRAGLGEGEGLRGGFPEGVAGVEGGGEEGGD